ncbi:hypothetical protein ACHAWX_006651 [Stephanocyclus meneghinianus]
MSIIYGIGDHWAFLIDFSTASLVGINPQPVVCRTARHLNTKILYCANKYNALMETQIHQHKLIMKLNITHHPAMPIAKLQEELTQ